MEIISQDKKIIKQISGYISETAEAYLNDFKISNKSDHVFREEDIKELIDLGFLKKVHLNDIKQTSLFLSFIFYVKVIVYNFLQKHKKHLKLKKLSDVLKDDNTEQLKVCFNHAIQAGYEDIFMNLKDFVPICGKNTGKIKQNIARLEKSKAEQFNYDIFGIIYNSIFNNEEQIKKGQHFTSNGEIDIINAFCINQHTSKVIDTACGSGAFLTRAFHRLKYIHKNKKQEYSGKDLTGVDIARIPILLTKTNLFIQNIGEPDIQTKFIHTDFSELNVSKKTGISIFDACIGNPPYIRQELIKNKQHWSNLLKQEYGINQISKQSDLYVYYLMITATLLSEGGRLGYVIASSWLDVSYGKDLQKYLLDHFRIIAIIDQQNSRSFQTASVNTIILIIEKCNDKSSRENNNVKFVRLKKDYEHFLGQLSNENRFKLANDFVQNIEFAHNLNNSELSIYSINQKELELNSTIVGKYQNGNWGSNYLRTSGIYREIVKKANNKLFPLKEFCKVKYGIKTGANCFFYLLDRTNELKNDYNQTKKYWRQYGIYLSTLDNNYYVLDRKHLKPILKSQREISGLKIDPQKLKYHVLDIKANKPEIKAQDSNLYNYIKVAESKKYRINERPTCASRNSKGSNSGWFNLVKTNQTGDFIFPSKIGEIFRLLDNRTANVYCDKVSYNVLIKPEYKQYSDILFGILNSTVFRYFIDLFSRQLTGSQTLSDVDVNVVQNTLIIHPKYLLKYEKILKDIMHSVSHREQKDIFREMNFNDRKQLDEIIMNSLGFKEKTELLRKYVVEFIENRNKKSRSVKANIEEEIL